MLRRELVSRVPLHNARREAMRGREREVFRYTSPAVEGVDTKSTFKPSRQRKAKEKKSHIIWEKYVCNLSPGVLSDRMNGG